MPEIKEAMDSFSEVWREKHRPCAETRFYHYTTLTGLQGILRERSLWLRHVSAFNDPNELQYGKRVVAQELHNMSELVQESPVGRFLRELLFWVEVFGDTRVHHTFTSCFCESGNVLSQWRAYGDSARGYNLELKLPCRAGICQDSDAPVFLKKVIYDESEQRKLVTDYLQRVLTAAQQSLRERKKDDYGHASVMGAQAANLLMDMLVCFKNAAFTEEKEWRLVYATDGKHNADALNFNEDLTPYFSARLYDSKESGDEVFPLRSVTFGPCLAPIRTRSAIQLLLNHLATEEHSIRIDPNIEIKAAGYELRQPQDEK